MRPIGCLTPTPPSPPLNLVCLAIPTTVDVGVKDKYGLKEALRAVPEARV
jgi:hypothetical protein